MRSHDRKALLFSFSLGIAALITACSGDVSIVGPTPPDNSPDDGVVLGTSWEALSYPTCVSAASDPDHDGWGWENNHSCVVATTSKPAFPTCVNPASDPDGDGWGWENNWFCVAQKASSSTGAAGSTGATGGSSSGDSSTSGTSTDGSTPASSTGTSSGSSSSSSSCANPEGTASTMAALAVAAASELKRWQPTTDFAIGYSGYSEILVLTAAGKARCADGVCANTQALLDFQKDEADGKVIFPGNVALNAPALRSRMVAKFRDQQACEMQPSNGGTTNCSAEQHQLIFQRSEKGGCDTNYYFVAKKLDGTPLQYPAQLKNKLLWADRVNPYIQFQSVGEVVSLDPTYGLDDAGSTSTGACTAACAKLGTTNVAGNCCSCLGVTKTFRRAAWNPNTYLCQ